MDRREAIRVIKELLADRDNDSRYPCVSSPRHYEALGLAIEALGQTEIDDCDNFYKGYCSVYEDGCFHQCEKDCINRKQAIEALTGWQTEPLDDDIVRTLEALPPVPQKQVTSKLKNPDDSLLTDDSDECKEQKSKLEETPTTSKTESVEGVAESATTTDCISRAKAIEEVKALPDTDNGYSDAYDKACIIGVLEELPSVAPKPVGDCISRADTIKALCAKCGLGHSCGDGYECPDVAVVRDMPPVEPKRPKGEWINGNPICPCCGENKFKDLDADIWSDWQPKYCPNCGADMRGDKE